MSPRKKPISGGNTTLFKLKNGKYVRRKSVTGGGIFGSILKHVNRNKSRILKLGSIAGKQVLKEAKTQLKKPENQKLLKNVTNQLIDRVTDKIDSTPPRRRKRHHRKRGAKLVSSASVRKVKPGLREDLLRLTKKEAKKIATKKSRQLVNNFSKYIE